MASKMKIEYANAFKFGECTKTTKIVRDFDDVAYVKCKICVPR